MTVFTAIGHGIGHGTEPVRHQCGYVLDDGHGGKRHGPRQLCAFGHCVQIFCPGCRRYEMGWGAIGCSCETGRSGHGTRAEFPRPSVAHLLKTRR
jgi:hypothetical protein